ncbi:hypothetical protein [Lautropia mirabilis]|uniref:hypothetical protein n=1 Tax=Lautropia mirabilis TaxID=47671 RepID=UPI0028E7EFD1|nr:hypothetical protein [Lautropia mirabilis]
MESKPNFKERYPAPHRKIRRKRAIPWKMAVWRGRTPSTGRLLLQHSMTLMTTCP